MFKYILFCLLSINAFSADVSSLDPSIKSERDQILNSSIDSGDQINAQDLNNRLEALEEILKSKLSSTSGLKLASFSIQNQSNYVPQLIKAYTENGASDYSISSAGIAGVTNITFLNNYFTEEPLCTCTVVESAAFSRVCKIRHQDSSASNGSLGISVQTIYGNVDSSSGTYNKFNVVCVGK
tara:strand:+ start:4114 stop:4659 length:546 start_codon:yes stop_codon:yes gene_type:complete